MVNPSDINVLANQRLTVILDAAEIGMRPEAFKAFRRIALREFGSNGFEADIGRLFEQEASGSERYGKGRNDDAKKGGAP